MTPIPARLAARFSLTARRRAPPLPRRARLWSPAASEGGDTTEFSDMARDIIESNQYMVLGTADDAGVPWVTPVWYAQSDYRRFIWVSSPDRRHSRNVRTRPEVSIVIFNSQVTEGSALAVYMSARAEELSGAELERDIAFFDTVSQVQGPTRRWAFEDISLRRPIDCIGRRCRSIGSSIQTAAPTPAPRSPCRAV
jgi:nitroimidazol reductase NimA-like FMN-containing flavoprotein (pyridoxamine 5'-phosphate oxidase superfamily)